MRPRLPLLLTLLLISCGDSPTAPPVSPATHPVTGTWSGILRDAGCGDGTLTIRIEQFQTEYGYFFHGTFDREFPGRGTPCNGSGRIIEGVMKPDTLSWWNLASSSLDCEWIFAGRRLGPTVIDATHARDCPSSGGVTRLTKQ